MTALHLIDQGGICVRLVSEEARAHRDTDRAQR